jgi:hypothetical protein
MFPRLLPKDKDPDDSDDEEDDDEEDKEKKAKSLKETNRMASVRDIAKLCAPDWHYFCVAFFGLSLAAAGESFIPLFFGKLIDAVSIDRDDDAFHKYMLYLILITMGTGIFTGVRGSTFILVGARFSVRLRRALFRSLLRQEIAFFDEHSTGEITSRLSNDTQQVGQQVELNVNVFLRSFLQALFILVQMAFISWELALTAFVSVPTIVFVSKVGQASIPTWPPTSHPFAHSHPLPTRPPTRSPIHPPIHPLGPLIIHWSETTQEGSGHDAVINSATIFPQLLVAFDDTTTTRCVPQPPPHTIHQPRSHPRCTAVYRVHTCKLRGSGSHNMTLACLA